MESAVQWDERIGRRLKLRDLNILMSVVQWGSMAKAAERLAVSQPVVSKAVSDLEHILGVRLLDRSRQGIEPTAYGHALLNRGLAAFDELRQGVKEIEFLTNPTVGEVRVGGTPATVESIFQIVIERLYRRQPQLKVEVTMAPSGPAMYQSLRERKVDLVVSRMLATAIGKDLEASTLFSDPIHVVAGANSKWARRRHVVLADLIDEPWVIPPSWTAPGELIGKMFHDNGLQMPQANVVTNSIALIHSLTARGPFLAALPLSVLKLRPLEPKLKILPIKAMVDQHPVGIVTLRGRTLTPAAQSFIDCIRDIIKPLSKAMDGLAARSRKNRSRIISVNRA